MCCFSFQTRTSQIRSKQAHDSAKEHTLFSVVHLSKGSCSYIYLVYYLLINHVLSVFNMPSLRCMYPLSKLIKSANEFSHLAAVKAPSGCLGNDALWVLIFGTPRCPTHPGAGQPELQLPICTQVPLFPLSKWCPITVIPLPPWCIDNFQTSQHQPVMPPPFLPV